LSKDTYQVEYRDTKIQVDQIMSALNEIARQIDRTTKKSLSKMKWVPKTDVDFAKMPRFDVDQPIFEVSVPAESTDDVNVFNEVLRVVPINDNTVQVVITDASIPPGKCEKIAIDFAQRLHEKTTGRKIAREQILVKNIAGLASNICEYCLEHIEGLPHACKACGRTFCYDHRRPETHGCQQKVRLAQPEHPLVKQQQPVLEKKSAQPKVVIRKIPCG